MSRSYHDSLTAYQLRETFELLSKPRFEYQSSMGIPSVASTLFVAITQRTLLGWRFAFAVAFVID